MSMTGRSGVDGGGSATRPSLSDGIAVVVCPSIAASGGDCESESDDDDSADVIFDGTDALRPSALVVGMGRGESADPDESDDGNDHGNDRIESIVRHDIELGRRRRI